MRPAQFARTSVPLRGVVVVEHCAEPYSDGLWHKWGTFRVGPSLSVDHIAVDSNWCVKYGVWEKLTDAAISEEYEAIKSNRFAADLKPAFDIAGIDFGRADHAKVGGRTIVYEINTNPFIGPYVPTQTASPRTQALARQRFATPLQQSTRRTSGTWRCRQLNF